MGIQSLGDQLSYLGFTSELAGVLKASIGNGKTPKVGIYGTSVSAQNSRDIPNTQPSPSRAFFTDGYATWMRILTSQRIDMNPNYNFGVSGDTLAMMYARIGTVLAAKLDFCIVECAPNDIPTLVTDADYKAMRATWEKLVTLLRQKGTTPIIIPGTARSGAVLTASQVRFQQQFYNYQREFCRKNAGYLFCDYLGYWLDQTSTASAPLTGMVKADNLHPTAVGAYWIGKALADLINPFLPPYPTNLLPNADIYNSVDNFTGNLLYSSGLNRGMMIGTGGTETANANLTYNGTGLAAGWTFLRGTATSVCTVTNSKESPRTDPGRSSGERQVVQIAAASGGGADEVYNLRFTPALADVAAGEWYYGECSMEVSAAPTNVMALEMYVLETRPTNSQTAIDFGMNSALAAPIPSVTWSGVLRTPPIQLTSDATALQFNIRARLKTDVGAAGITFKVGDAALRKVDPAFV